MKQNAKTYLLLSLCCLSLLCTKAQSDSKQQVVSHLKKVAEVYRTLPYLSFNVLYRYAWEENPSVYVDSLQGSFKLRGSQYWFALDQTETIGNKDLMVMLFKEDEVMYVSKPTGGITGLPSAMLDSFILHHDQMVYDLEETKGSLKITLNQQNSAPFKKVEYTIDPKTHLIQHIRCYATASVLFDPIAQPLLDKQGYAIIEVVFSDYQQQRFSDSLFNTGNYFIRQGDEMVTVRPYQSYKLFLGSPNL